LSTEVFVFLPSIATCWKYVQFAAIFYITLQITNVQRESGGCTLYLYFLKIERVCIFKVFVFQIK